MLFGRDGSGPLDHIKHLEKTYAKRNSFLKMVTSTFQTTDWRNMYGLSITETMDLSFADYIFMLDELNRHEKMVKANSDEITANLLNDKSSKRM